MSEPDLYFASPRETRGMVLDCLYAGLVPFVKSSPGLGKSSIMRSIADELGLQMIDHRLSTSAPEDLTGLPRFTEDGKARFAPFADLFPLEGQELPKGKEGWMLFLDEANSATKSVQAAAYKLILDKMTGQFNLHERCAITAAGNLSTDRAIVVDLSTAIQSRVVHIQMEVNFEEWLEDVAIANSWDDRVIAYLSYKNESLMDFKPDHKEQTYCCPRTWEFVNKLLARKPKIQDKDAKLLAGTITSGVAVDFVQFCAVFDAMISVKDIAADPENCSLPSDSATRWAVVTHMASQIEESNIDALATYANRLPMDFRILFFRSMMIRQPGMQAHPAFRKAMIELSNYLNADDAPKIAA